MSRSLADYTDAELIAAQQASAEHVTFYYADIEREMERRVNQAQVAELVRATKVATGAAVISAAAAAFALVVAIVAVVTRPA